MENKGSFFEQTEEQNDIDKLAIFDDVDENQETEEDLNEESLKSISEVVVTATDWTTETILKQLERGNILLSPKYQRRDAWTRKHKSKFIESLFLGLPIPQIILAEQKGQRGKYIVIDGKQRLLSLRQFASTNQEGYKPLKLIGLEIMRELNGKALQDIEEDGALYDELTSFQNQTIRTVVVRNWPDENLLFLLFLRLNTGSVKLSPQELRQALHPGPFVDFLDDFTAEDNLIKGMLGIKRADFRMRDVEILLRYFALVNFISDYTGDLKKFLDETCNKLNTEWEKNGEGKFLSQVESLRSAVNTVYSLFSEKNAFRKWNGERYERQFNRSVFDIMVFFFVDEKISREAANRKYLLSERFKELCTRNIEFKSSIETTTKSLTATYTRLKIWRDSLSELLEIEIPDVSLVNGRIQVSQR